jgi:broad specificity phosphatase PhoE
MICLVRHAEPAGVYGEASNPGLSELGRQQADQAAVLLRELGAKRAVTSPMTRCRQTARAFEMLAETNARIEPAVSEIIAPADEADRRAWLTKVMAGSWSDAGPGLDGWRRACLAAVSACPGGTAVFSHFVAINAVVGLLGGDDRVLQFHPGHASITVLERRGGVLAVTRLGTEAGSAVL